MKSLLLTLIVILLMYIPEGKCQNVQELISLIHEYSEKNNYPGVMIAITRSDSVLFSGGVGFAYVKDSLAVNEKQLFRQGSVSKSFIALALIKLLHDQNLSLKTPIRDIDPNIPFKNDWAASIPITVEHLLESSAGFDDFHAHAIYNFKDSLPPPTTELIHSHRKSLFARWKPGTRHAYSNSGYVVAGHLIEKLSGIPYQQYIAERILSPLGMTSSGFYFKQPADIPFAAGYSFSNGQYQEVPFVSLQAGPAGDLCANADDMIKFLQFMLTRNGALIDSSVFTKATFDRIENSEATSAGQAGLPGGYGLGNFSVWQNGFVFHGHDGGIDGYSSRYIYSRDANLGIAVAVNTTKDPTPIVELILNQMFGKPSEHLTERATFPIPQQLKDKYEGFYVFRNPRQQFKAFINNLANNFLLKFEGDQVFIKTVFGQSIDTMTYAGNNQFYRNIEDVPSVIMFENDEGNKAIGIKRNYAEKESLVVRMVMNIIIVISMIVPFLYMAYFGVVFLIQLIRRKQIFPLPGFLLFIACLCFPVMFYGFATAATDRFTAGTLTFHSGLLFVSSTLMATLSVYSIFQLFSIKRSKSFRVLFSITTASLVILSLFLWDSGFIGMRLWAY